MAKRKRIKLKAVPEPPPDSATSTGDPDYTGPLLIGDSPDGSDYVCRQCGQVILQAIGPSMRIVNVYFQCGSCAAWSLSPHAG